MNELVASLLACVVVFVAIAATAEAWQISRERYAERKHARAQVAQHPAEHVVVARIYPHPDGGRAPIVTRLGSTAARSNGKQHSLRVVV